MGIKVFELQRSGFKTIVFRVGFTGDETTFQLRIAINLDVETALACMNAGLFGDDCRVTFGRLIRAGQPTGKPGWIGPDAKAGTNLFGVGCSRIKLAFDIEIAADIGNHSFARDCRTAKIGVVPGVYIDRTAACDMCIDVGDGLVVALALTKASANAGTQEVYG